MLQVTSSHSNKGQSAVRHTSYDCYEEVRALQGKLYLIAEEELRRREVVEG